jgi:hypothetical protein
VFLMIPKSTSLMLLIVIRSNEADLVILKRRHESPQLAGIGDVTHRKAM